MTEIVSTPARRGRKPTIDLRPEMRFGAWTVRGEVEGTRNRRRVLCRCDCGTERAVIVPSLLTGRSKSCGCLAAELTAEKKAPGKTERYPDGRAPTSYPEFECWRGMVRRCTDPRVPNYRKYGARGVMIDPRWLEPNGRGFFNFLEDMGRRPSPRHSVDRINGAMIYSKATCRWATYAEQGANTRTAYKIRVGDEVLSLAEAARRAGMDAKAFAYRMRVMGWSVEKTMTEPLVPRSERSQNKPRRFVLLDGELISLAEASRRTGMKENTLRKRMRRGLTGGNLFASASRHS